jgi:UDPglucose 6-dehydrogenase
VNISVIGTGYVGLVVGACLAETGNYVVCADVDRKKIDGLQQNHLPIYEPGLLQLVERNQQQSRLRFTDDIAGAIASASVIFIAVGTPPDEDGSADLRHVLAVAEQIGRHMARELVVVTKSTVPVGTAAKVGAAVGRHARHPFHLCSNPEFLKEGAAVDDFLKPDRVVLGVDTDHARSVMAELYAPFVRTGKPIVFMDIPSAEMTKYAANAMLATRISFMNEIAALCEKVGANVDHVRKGIGSDPRIGASFLFPGAGYGGSCFPKDVKALIRTAAECQTPLEVLQAVEDVNDRQKHRLFDKVSVALDGKLRGALVAVWGLAFKPQTDDMREAPALTLIEELLEAGARVCAHDPVAVHEAKRRLGDRVRFVESYYDAVDGADALAIVTDWNEYRHPDFARIKQALRQPVLIDGRNLYDPVKMLEMGFVYDSVGRPMARLAARPAATLVA